MDVTGRIQLARLEEALRSDTALVSVMHADIVAASVGSACPSEHDTVSGVLAAMGLDAARAAALSGSRSAG